ncbi:unnamed protein product [Rhizophagus irregularis]|nr:unnamed protein product [Rhizophagus irregularis]
MPDESFQSEINKNLELDKTNNIFHSKPYDFSIPTNIDDFNNSSNQTSKIHNFMVNSKNLSKPFEKLQINDGSYVNFDDDEDDVYNNPNFHSEDQDEFEIPEDI